jgi:hypothetical protein
MLLVRRARRVISVLTLAGLVAPCAFGFVVTVHLAEHHAAEHHDDGHHDPVDLVVVWHGHSHAARTPPHDHPLLVAGTHAIRIPTAAQLSLDTPGCWQYPAYVATAALRVPRLSPPGIAGVGPPPRLERLSILRI